MRALIAPLIALNSVKKMVIIGSVVFELNPGRIRKVCQNFTIFVHLAYLHSGSAGPIFAIFTSNESVLGVDDRSGPFLISQGTLPWQPILCKFCEMTYIRHPGILKRTRCTIVLQINTFIATLIALHRVKNGENRFSSF